MLSINLTTTASRLELCSSTLWSLLHQTIIPDEINVWVSKEPYLADEGINEIPIFITELNSVRNIIKIKFTKNIGPYRKIIPILRESNADDIIVYADDDVIYGCTWLETLYDEFLKNSCSVVVASRVRLMQYNVFGKLKSYLSFPLCTESILLENDFIITGVGGCILSRSIIKDEFITNNEFMSIAPTTDDIWISKIIELSGGFVKCLPVNLKNINEISHEINALSQDNMVIKYKSNILIRFANKIINKVKCYFCFFLFFMNMITGY